MPEEAPSGLVWAPEHLDSPPFDRIVGISLLGTVRLRFRRGSVRDWETWSQDATPRSAYVLADEARSGWQHSIPPAKELRYSVTFRDLR